MPRTLPSHGFGVRLRKYRDEAGLSQDALATRCGKSRTWITDMEGGGDPKLSDAIEAAEVLSMLLRGVTMRQVLLGDQAGPDDGRVDDERNAVKRRRFVGLAVTGGVAALSGPIDIERLAEAGRHGIDDRLIDALRALTRAHGRLRSSMGPAELLPMVERHLLNLSALLSDYADRGLASTLAGSAVQAGWLCFALDDRSRARAHFDVAERLGRQIDDQHVLALALIGRADMCSGIPGGEDRGCSKAALALLEEARSHVVPAHSVELRTWILLRLAEERAFVEGRTAATAVRRDLDEAERVWRTDERRGDDVRGQWPSDTNIVAAFRGNSARLLGEPVEAVEILSGVVQAWPGARPPGERIAALTDLAAAHAELGAIDHACDLLAETTRILSSHDHPERARRVVGIRQRYLTPWNGEGMVRRLDEQLASIL